MPRLTLKQMRLNTRLPRVIGACIDDIPTIAESINGAQERLVFAHEAGDEGWWGAYAEVLFNILPSDPYLTLNREQARLEAVNICKKPVVLNNPFQEYLLFGNGVQPKYSCTGAPDCTFRQVYDRLQVPMFRDLSGTNRILRMRASDSLDTQGTKRVFISGTDVYDNPLTSLDGINRVSGIYVTLAAPFVDVPVHLNSVTGIQKDATNGTVTFYDVDPTTAEETTTLIMQPPETVSGYRRYYLNGLPGSCCPQVKDQDGNLTVQVNAIVKLALLPVQVDTDYLLIQSAEAIIAECQSARYSTMDTPAAKSLAVQSHQQAVRYLQGEMAHHLGTDNSAVSFDPSGLAGMERDKVGTLI